MTYFLIYYQVFRNSLSPSSSLCSFYKFNHANIQYNLLLHCVNVLSFGYKNNYLPWMTLLSLTSSHWPFKNLSLLGFILRLWASKIGQIQIKKNNLNCQPSCELTGLEIKKARYLYTFNMFRQQQSQRGPWYLDMSRPLLTKQFDIIWQEWRGKLFCEGE